MLPSVYFVLKVPLKSATEAVIVLRLTYSALLSLTGPGQAALPNTKTTTRRGPCPEDYPPAGLLAGEYIQRRLLITDCYKFRSFVCCPNRCPVAVI